MRLVDPLIGGAFVPFQSLGKIPRIALALLMHGTKIILRQSVFLFGGALVPVHRLGGIPIDTEAALIHHADAVLGAGMALLRQRLPCGQRGAIVAISRRHTAGFEILRLHRPGEQRQE